MKTTLALLAATTALAAVLTLPALADDDRRARSDDSRGEHVTLRDRMAQLFHVFDDDDDGHRHGGRHHDDDDDDDDDDGGSRGRMAAPAGSVAPPANGLFGTGTPPRVQMN